MSWAMMWYFICTWIFTKAGLLLSFEMGITAEIHNSIFLNFMDMYPANTKHLYNICSNVGQTSKTLGRRCTNVVQKFCVCRVNGYKVYCYLSLETVHITVTQNMRMAFKLSALVTVWRVVIEKGVFYFGMIMSI